MLWAPDVGWVRRAWAGGNPSRPPRASDQYDDGNESSHKAYIEIRKLESRSEARNPKAEKNSKTENQKSEW